MKMKMHQVPQVGERIATSTGRAVVEDGSYFLLLAEVGAPSTIQWVSSEP
jgi:hypothetical protein